jgi:AraC family transcriptional regulator of adaptative response / DNA-3-methyladenine glycosylase II
VALEPGRDHVRATFRLGTVADLPAAVARCRRLLDLDADPHAVAAALSGDEALAPLVAARPGLRAPGTVDGAEWAMRAVIGQQVSLGAARTLTARIVAAFGKPLDQPDGGLSHAFPSPGTLAEVGLESVGLTGPRAETLRELARRLADGALSLDPGADRGEVERAMTEIPGIGPWTVGHVALRALGDPDAFPVGDLGLRRAARRLGLPGEPGALVRRAEHWRPWRGYAAHYLWEVTG